MNNEDELAKNISELYTLAVKGKIASLTDEEKRNGDLIALSNTAVNEVCELFLNIGLFKEETKH